MGVGIDLARDLSPEHAQAMDNMKDQLIIILIKKLGGKVMLPVIEVDNTAGDLLYMSLDPTNQMFTFEVRKKS